MAHLSITLQSVVVVTKESEHSSEYSSVSRCHIGSSNHLAVGVTCDTSDTLPPAALQTPDEMFRRLLPLCD